MPISICPECKPPITACPTASARFPASIITSAKIPGHDQPRRFRPAGRLARPLGVDRACALIDAQCLLLRRPRLDAHARAAAAVHPDAAFRRLAQPERQPAPGL